MDSELLAILLLIANGVAISFLVKYPIRQWLGIEKKPKERDFYDSETHDQLILHVSILASVLQES